MKRSNYENKTERAISVNASDTSSVEQRCKSSQSFADYEQTPLEEEMGQTKHFWRGRRQKKTNSTRKLRTKF